MSLRDSLRSVILVSLPTVGRVDELQAVAWDVSFASHVAFLSYLPEFLAKTESDSNLLPRSFIVRDLLDFVGVLPGELLLCPVRAMNLLR